MRRTIKAVASLASLFLLISVVFFNGYCIAECETTTPINPSKWNNLEQIREVTGGKLRLGVQGFEETLTTRMFLKEDNTNYLEAKVLVETESLVSTGNRAYARIDGMFYNDTYPPGNAGDGPIGDVWAMLKLELNDNQTLTAMAYLSRMIDQNYTDKELFSANFDTQINFNTEYILSIEFTGSEMIFKCNDEVLTYSVPTGYDSKTRQRELASRVYGGTGNSGHITATFDDIVINKGGAVYEDFENGCGLVKGDINDDGKIDLREAINALQIVSGNK